jgi:hypothetical protein
MVSRSNVIGQMRARINVIASAQAIGWQLIAIHVKHMELFMIWNKCGTSMRDEKTVERSVGIEASWFDCVVGRDAKWKCRISEEVFLIWLKQ